MSCQPGLKRVVFVFEIYDPFTFDMNPFSYDTFKHNTYYEAW